MDYRADFFGKPAFLTVSGQLNAEYYACGLSNVYTFGPTFRAENSHTARHLAEFLMIEPEMAFCTLEDDMQCAEDYVRFCCRHLLDTCRCGARPPAWIGLQTAALALGGPWRGCRVVLASAAMSLWRRATQAGPGVPGEAGGLGRDRAAGGRGGDAVQAPELHRGD